MTTIPALIEKLRGLKGPDREVDAEIDAALRIGTQGGRDGCPWLWANFPTWRKANLRPGWVEAVHSNGTGGPMWAAEPITASLDLVVDLIERDGAWDWSIHRDNGEAIAGVQPASEDGCDCAGAHAPTPALALLIAFLEAKMEMEK